MAKRSNRPADLSPSRQIATARLHGTSGEDYEQLTQETPETFGNDITTPEILAREDELVLAFEADRVDIVTELPIIKHNAYSIVNVEFTLNELHARRDITNPWASHEDLLEIYQRLPDYLVPEHFEFYFEFLRLSGIVQSRGARIKCFKPGLRADGRPITSKALLLTLFPTGKKEWETGFLCSYLTIHATYFIGGQEVCPTTGREHIHVFVQVGNVKELKWLKVIFPTINVKSRLANQTAARDYAIKDGNIVMNHGEFVAGPTMPGAPLTRGGPGGEANKQRWKRIMELAQNNDVATIKDEFPAEFFRFNVTIEKIAAQAHMRQLQSKPPLPVDLLKKNFYIWGHAGTGKTWLARRMAGELPYSKAQNKWWDGYTEQVTGIVFNDISPMLGFNWQTVLDAGDIYPFFAEVKNGSCTICATAIPVIITSNYSPEEIMAGQNESRLQALKRRFSIVKVEWVYMGKMKMLKWTYDPKSGFRAPTEQWWHQVASDTDEEMEFERSIEAEEDEHEERAEHERATDDEENPFVEQTVDLRRELEAQLIESRRFDQEQGTAGDEAVYEFSQRSRELLDHIQELEDRLRLMHPSIVASRVASSDTSEQTEAPEEEDKDEQSSTSPDTMPEVKPN
jgi:regulator of sigma D